MGKTLNLIGSSITKYLKNKLELLPIASSITEHMVSCPTHTLGTIKF